MDTFYHILPEFTRGKLLHPTQIRAAGPYANKRDDPIAARSPLLCPALRRNRTKQRSAAIKRRERLPRRNRTKQRSAAIKRRERLPFDRGAAALKARRLLKLKCSLPQCDSFFKGPFSIFNEKRADFTPKNAAPSVHNAQKKGCTPTGRHPKRLLPDSNRRHPD